MNRMVDPDSPEWAQWIVLFTLGGFFGNFVFSLTDHAEDGFFNPLEWVPIYASAIAVGFLAVPLVMRVSRRFLDSCGLILLLEAAVGLWGGLSCISSETCKALPRTSSTTTSTALLRWPHCSSRISWSLASSLFGDCVPASPKPHFPLQHTSIQCTRGRLVCAAGQKRKT